MGSNSKVSSWKQYIESTSLSNSKNTEASMIVSLDDLTIDYALVPTTLRIPSVFTTFYMRNSQMLQLSWLIWNLIFQPKVGIAKLCVFTFLKSMIVNLLFYPIIDYTRHLSTTSYALVELNNQFDYFKERQLQLIKHLHNLDLNYQTTSSTQDFMYWQSSLSWN